MFGRLATSRVERQQIDLDGVFELYALHSEGRRRFASHPEQTTQNPGPTLLCFLKLPALLGWDGESARRIGTVEQSAEVNLLHIRQIDQTSLVLGWFVDTGTAIIDVLQ